MQYGISVQIHWGLSDDSPNVTAQMNSLLMRLSESFTQYPSKTKAFYRMGCADFRVFQEDAVNEIAKWMDSHGHKYQIEKYQIVVSEFWTMREFVRALGPSTLFR